ncbi:MAG: SGNH/GDSL hydrolase family protein [Clostridia bacterium]|nr:SGNH/GDSL hydrolase family protein [Clostridia bacterium]
MKMETFIGKDDELPLDSCPHSGGFTSIFRTVAAIGDSLASGEFMTVNAINGKPMGVDSYDYSWAQFMARIAGITVYNFSEGGMTAEAYFNSFANARGFFRPELCANAYIIALGVNDILNKNKEIGTVSDIHPEDYRKNAENFAGYIGRIISKYKEISPEAKFFLVTIPDAPRNDYQRAQVKEHAALMYKIAELFDSTYVIDLNKYGPYYGKEFRQKYFLRGHLAPAGYYLTAQMMCSYIDYIVRKNPEDFRYVGLMGYEYERREDDAL